MNTTRNPFVKSIATVSVGAVATGCLLFAGAPAANADSTVKQPSISQAATSGGTSAHIWAKAATVVDVTAGATAVAISGVDVTGKILLEEVRTVDSNKAVRNVKVPSKKQVRLAPTVHSQQQGQALATKMVTKYKNKVAKAKLKIRVLKLKLKHAETRKERIKFKRQLKQAQKQFKRIKADVPRMKAAHGVEFLNSGYRDRLDLIPLHDRVDGQFDVFQYVPEVDDFVIIVKIGLDGTWVEGCHNYVAFIIPPGTPAAELFLIVRDITKVFATVTVGYTEHIDLTVGGELYCPGGQIVRDEKTERTQKSDFITKTGVPVTKVKKWTDFGEELVRIHKESRVGASVSVSDSLVNQIGAELNLECPNTPPVLEIVQFGEHLFPNGEMRYKVVAGDQEDGSSIPLTLANISVTGAASLLVDAEHPVHEDIEGNQKVLYFWVKAGNTPGNYTVKAKVTDSDGDPAEVSITKPVTPDEF